ncbi:MAG: lipopolysaccharide transport system permease protein [Sphingomonadales bacterium]|jgi:ABC-type polysaccharide/polyol phosphate export permease|nr:lipopolysaccharide transport system permease protein [Sphingomonadales bacterium]
MAAARSEAEWRRPSRLRAAIDDMVEGARHWPQWFTLGNIDIKLRFRRSGLGPLWSTLSFAVLAAALGLVYSRLFGEPVATYLPYVVLGLFVWGFLASTLQEACDVFVAAEHALKQYYVPRTTLVYRALWRNLVLLGLNFTVVAGVLALCGTRPAPAAPLALAGLALLLLGLFPASLLLALATVRFRAVARIVQTALPIGMLVTPILWRPATPELRDVAEMNPFYFAIELVRGPILGEAPPPLLWAAAAGCVVILLAAALLAFGAVRHRITYWL